MTTGALEFQFLFESIPASMIMILTPELTISAANDLWCEATATERSDAIGRGLFELFPDNPDDLNSDGVSHVRASLDRVLREQVDDVMQPIKYDIELPDGHFEERYWSITNSPLIDADGVLVGIVNRADDVTEYIRLKQQEEQVAALIDSDPRSLESTIVRQTREAALASRELKTANADLARLNAEATATADQLAHANRDLEQFAYVVSHDLQAPVRNIAGIAELLRERFAGADLSDEDKKYFRLLEQSTSRMLAQIQGLLKISRLQTSVPSLAEVDLAAVAKDAVRDAADAIRETEATVTVASDLPTIEADPVQMSLLLQNLIGNALKYRRLDVPPQVEVSAETVDGSVEILVRDNGIGIGRDHQERIFRMFQRLHSPRDTNYRGTGIGLALALKIVSIHHGTIWVESAGQGMGSTFHVRLPIRQPLDPISSRSDQ